MLFRSDHLDDLYPVDIYRGSLRNELPLHAGVDIALWISAYDDFHGDSRAIDGVLFQAKKMVLMEYVVLLRAVNLGKRNQVNMGVLRALLAENGYRDVESILNSGNVLLRSEKTPLEIKQRIALLISERFNVEIEVFVLRKDDLLKSIDSYPFEPLNEKIGRASCRERV